MTPEEISNEFAGAFPEGTLVVYYPTRPFRKDRGIRTKIVGKPWILGSGHVLVKVEGQTGGVSVEHIIPDTPRDPYSQRSMRAKRFADTVLNLMHDFLPVERVCRRRIYAYIEDTAYEANAQIVEVPPELDALDQLRVEAAFLQAKMEPPLILARIPTDADSLGAACILSTEDDMRDAMRWRALMARQRTC